VLKFDGLAAGKGVAVCPDEASALAFLDEVFTQRRFGPGRVLVEECLTGPEVSVFAAIVDDQYLVFTPARDYKRALDGDLGPNTGGMGAVASRQPRFQPKCSNASSRNRQTHRRRPPPRGPALPRVPLLRADAHARMARR
jgi:phosphoribosylamine-glycine ligase